MVVTSFKRLVTPEMDHIILVLDEFQTEGLVPSIRKHVKGDFAADRELKVHIFELAP